MFKKFRVWWLLHVMNHKVRVGEKGAFKWVFRRYTFSISTVSGNFKAQWTADEHPYGYLLASVGDDNIHGFCQIMYEASKLLTTDQIFIDDIVGALDRYEKRLSDNADVTEDKTEEKIAIEEVKAVQEYVDATPKERRKYERDVNGRFKKVVKAVEDGSKAE